MTTSPPQPPPGEQYRAGPYQADWYEAGQYQSGPRRLYRSADGRVLGGVCEGLSKHTRIDVWIVRAAFIVSCLFAASGALAYAAFWLFVPLEMDPRGRASGASGTGLPGPWTRAAGAGTGTGTSAGFGTAAAPPAPDPASASGPRPASAATTSDPGSGHGTPSASTPSGAAPDSASSADPGYVGAAPFAYPGSAPSAYPGPHPERPPAAPPGPAARVVLLLALAGGLLLLLGTEVPGLRGHWSVLGLVAAVCAGLAVAWREADDEQRARWLSPTRRLRRRDMVRAAVGAVVVLGGIAALVASNTSWQQATRALVGAAALLAGLVLVVLPYLLRVVRDLSAERAERIRAQERAEVAAMMHDSVLHTLALIQRKSTDPVQVARLARAQERELRSWLYTDRGRAAERGADTGRGPAAERGPDAEHAAADPDHAAAAGQTTGTASATDPRTGPDLDSGPDLNSGPDPQFGADLAATPWRRPVPTTFAAAIKDAIAQVEDRHGVPIEVVTVGDAPLDDGLRACVAAAREAAVNAAKYAAGAAITVYAEVETAARSGAGIAAAFDGRGPDEPQVSAAVYVRDRGPGFDLEDVAADRMGIRESIIGRMNRHGGTGTVKTAPGEGTEVRLELRRV